MCGRQVNSLTFQSIQALTCTPSGETQNMKPRKPQKQKLRWAALPTPLFLLVAVTGACVARDFNPSDNETQSTKALAELFPNPAERRKFEAINLKLWNALEPFNCKSCHSTPKSPGWETTKMPYWDFWKSSVFTHLDLVDKEVSEVKPTNFRLYRLLSGEMNPMMPPKQNGGRSDADATLLNALDGTQTENFEKLVSGPTQCNGASSATECLNKVRNALGESPIYTNSRGVCFDKTRLGQLANIDSLCSVFDEYAKAVGSFRGTLKDSLTAWGGVATTAGKINHYDKIEGEIVEEQSTGGDGGTVVGGDTGGTPSGGALKERFLFSTPGSTTISYYTRVAPDDSAIAITQSGTEKYVPKVISLSDFSQQKRLNNVSYDAVYTPDYSLAKRKGFIHGARGFLGTELQKVYGFFAPGTNGEPIRSITFDDISGYGSVALITQKNASQIAPRWKKVWENKGDYYLLMGKRWRWAAIRAVADGNGATKDVIALGDPQASLPGGTATGSPVCSKLTDSTGRNDTGVAFAESMLSGDGRFISLNSNKDNALLIVNTKNCAIEHAPTLQNKYMQGGKAAFSMDGEYIVFHAFGANGLSAADNGLAADGAIRNLANSGRIANIFVYSVSKKKTVQLTNYTTANAAVAWFPNFNGNSSKLYYHRHRPGKSASEVLVIDNPLAAFNAQ